MTLTEFLEDKGHIRCRHCDNIFLTAPSGVPGGENFDTMNTVLHLVTCHPEVVEKDQLLKEEVISWLGADAVAQ